MKKLLCLLALLPATAFAQIYPLHEYTSTLSDKGQEIKFLRNPDGLTFVGTCKGSGASRLCNLAKDGHYKTKSGLEFTVRGHALKKDGVYCNYVGDKEHGELECKDGD